MLESAVCEDLTFSHLRIGQSLVNGRTIVSIGGLTKVQFALLMVVAFTLLVRGAFVSALWGTQILAGSFPTTSFLQAIFFKDTIYAVTAVTGGACLFLHPRIGWWCAMLHWIWYVIWQVVLVAIAEFFSWQSPVRISETLYLTIPSSLGLATLGIVVLAWKPIRKYCGVNEINPFRAIVFLFMFAFLISLVVNWCSSL
jgi:hypothetical protein